MADLEQMKENADKLLFCLEKLASFASSIHPTFGFVSPLIRVARTGLTDEKVYALDKNFQKIHTKLKSISQKNQQCLRQIHISEVNEIFGMYEEYEEHIKHQYDAFNEMVRKMKKDPDQTEHYMKTFQTVYETNKSDISLDVYYRGVLGTGSLFGKPLLKVYLENCDGDREIMEHRCSYIAHLFYMGFIALGGYTTVTKDDEDAVREKWDKRVKEIQEKMQEVLSQCRDRTA
ncbi:protein rapunzel-like [Toxotes jaculatrix]|uniref:protein rapunzel-like n=1 Tax=Toxotes jaculatrix TaxID=941984 RepID=UPI001B3AB6D2|nr:protein rapunzel-like [Toxotes jaculatrix]